MMLPVTASLVPVDSACFTNHKVNEKSECKIPGCCNIALFGYFSPSDYLKFQYYVL